MKQNKIILYGHFGSGNIGNDSSLEAALHHVRQYRPDARIVCVCNEPQEIEKRFGIESLSMSGNHANEKVSSGLGSRIRRLLKRFANEILFWLERPHWYNPGDQFIVVGTGAVDDMAVRRPWHAPYALYKWCKTAKMGGARLVFLSVGVGPIVNPVSRFLMLKALRMADYRSYRETAAFRYLQSVGYNTTGDRLYPDLVFSLPKDSIPEPRRLSTASVVGLGLINYYGWKHDPRIGEFVHQEYMSKIERFAAWLFDQGYTVRVLSGDSTDLWPARQLAAFVKAKGESSWRERFIVEQITNVDDLFAQIAQTDIVVASRFHNVLCSLLLERPVISLGYHEKNINLMTEMGLENYCQDIEQFTFEKLVEQFQCYAAEMEEVVQNIHLKNEQYRQQLDEQYRNLLVNAEKD